MKMSDKLQLVVSPWSDKLKFVGHFHLWLPSSRISNAQQNVNKKAPGAIFRAEGLREVVTR